MSIQNINNDNLSVVSDITDFNDGNTISSLDIEDKISEIKMKLNTELNKLNMDNLKEKCKELGINGLSKLKKPELIPILETEFLKLITILHLFSFKMPIFYKLRLHIILFHLS
jgi:hypothetical protein